MAYDWTLKVHGSKLAQFHGVVAKYLETFPLWRDSGAKLVDYAEYCAMIERGEIAPAVSYWQIRADEVGFVARTEYMKYSETWSKILTAYEDFQAGWRAAMRFRDGAGA